MTLIIFVSAQPAHGIIPPPPAFGVLVSGQPGLTITGSNVTISHLVIDGFRDDGIRGDGDNLTLKGNFIGMNAAGTAAAPNAGFGVQVRGANALIGGATSGGPCSG